MKTKAILYPLIALILGAVGAVLHRIQLSTIIDESTGLALRWAPITIALAAVCVLAAVLAFLFSLSFSRRSAAPDWHKSLASRTPLPMILAVLSFAGMLYGAWQCWRWGLDYGGTSLLDRILAVFAALAGLGGVILAITSFRKRHNGLEAISSLVVVLFLCLWLVLVYKANSSDPTKIKYIYDLLGLCAAAVGCYYLAGYAFGRSRPRSTIFFCLTAIALSAVAFPVNGELSGQLFSAFTILFLFVNVMLLMLNLAAPRSEEEPAEEAHEAEEDELPGIALPGEEDLTDGLLKDMPEEPEGEAPELDEILREYREKDE